MEEGERVGNGKNEKKEKEKMKRRYHITLMALTLISLFS
jgi:hypothetical protein